VSIMPEEDYADGYVPAASILPIADIEKDARSRISNWRGNGHLMHGTDLTVGLARIA